MQEDTPIAKVMEMKVVRIAAGLTFKDHIDEFKDPDGNTDLDLILDSSKVFGALIIKKHVVEIVKRRRVIKAEAEAKKIGMIATTKAPETSKDDRELPNSPLIPETDTDEAGFVIDSIPEGAFKKVTTISMPKDISRITAKNL
jgi:hypothetical protein